MTAKSAAIRLAWVVNTQFGIDVLRLGRSVPGLVRFVRDLRKFRSAYTGELRVLPCLHDWSEPGGAAHGEYFWQDLIVARMIFRANPRRHVDVGSRVDGFVAHVASFREIEVFDVRPNDARVPGIKFTQADLMRDSDGLEECCDSISCLHALEHFGLGRYGDPIEVGGHERGLRNIARLLEQHGVLYLSVPVGIERVEFNAHRIFDPRAIVAIASGEGLELMELTTIGAGSGAQNLALDDERLAALALQTYELAIFVFRKKQRRDHGQVERPGGLPP